LKQNIEGEIFVQVTRQGTAPSYDKIKGFSFQLLAQSENMEMMLVQLVPKAETEVFRHPGEEAHLVLEGELEVIVDDRTYHLGPGDAIWHRSDRPHKWRNPADTNAKVVAFASPRTSVSKVISKGEGV